MLHTHARARAQWACYLILNDEFISTWIKTLYEELKKHGFSHNTILLVGYEFAEVNFEAQSDMVAIPIDMFLGSQQLFFQAS